MAKHLKYFRLFQLVSKPIVFHFEFHEIDVRANPVALCANKIDPSNDDDDEGLAKEASEAWERAKLSKELDAALADLEFKRAAERLKERAG